METDRRSQAVFAVLGVVVAILVVVAVILAVQPPPEFDPATPEGTAQGYFRAVLDDDPDLARTYLTAELADDCDTHELRHFGPDRARVVIAHTEVTGDRARVEVQITETWGDGPFGADSHSFDETLVMEHHGDRWLIARLPWPIEYTCN